MTFRKSQVDPAYDVPDLHTLPKVWASEPDDIAPEGLQTMAFQEAEVTHLDNKESAKGAVPIKSVTSVMEIGHMSKFYYPASNSHSLIEREGLDSDSGTQYLKGKLSTLAEMRKAAREWVFPQDFRRFANIAGQRLQPYFEEVGGIKVLRDQPEGRFDSRKIPTVMSEIARGGSADDIQALRPYRRRDIVQSIPPLIVFVVSSGWAEMWQNPMHIPVAGSVALGMGMACEAAGLRFHACMSVGVNYARHQGFVIIGSSERPQSLKGMSVLMHRDMFRWGMMTASGASPQVSIRHGKLFEDRLRDAPYGRLPPEKQPHPIGHTWGSVKDGGYAVAHARQMWNPDYIVAIGEIRDGWDADVFIKKSDMAIPSNSKGDIMEACNRTLSAMEVGIRSALKRGRR